MELITRSFGGVEREYPIYTREEADEKGLEYLYWKDVEEAGQWALSDDGYVGEVRKVATYDSGYQRRKFVTLTYARVWASASTSLFFEERLKKRAFAQTCAKSWDEVEVQRTRTKRMVVALVEMMLGPEKIDYEKLGNIYRPDQEIPEATVRRVLKNEKVQQLVQQTLREALSEEGIDERRVIEMFNETYFTAKKEGATSSMARVAENFRDMLGMSPDQQKTEESLDVDYSKLVEGRAEEEKLRAQGKRKRITTSIAGEEPGAPDQRDE